MAVVSPAVCSGHLSCMPHLAFARMICKVLELQTCLEQGPGLSCVLAPRCPPPVYIAHKTCIVFYRVCKTPKLASEILRGPCSVSEKCFSISEYLSTWEHPASCAILLLLPGRVGWRSNATSPLCPTQPVQLCCSPAMPVLQTPLI